MHRVLLDPQPNSGAWNMAVDEVLLEAALDVGTLCVRCYEWDVPTVSLGYFQDSAAVSDDPRFASLAVVRRLSGGGAILHHHELTYSCGIPPGHRLSPAPAILYDVIHEAIVALLRDRGVSTTLRGQALSEREGLFLCYGRGDPRDVVLAGHKIVGSAQRRRRGAVLQHGSILLAASKFAPEFPGVNDLTQRSITAAELAAPLAAAIASRLTCASIDTPPSGGGTDALSIHERRRAEFLCETRYRHLDGPLAASAARRDMKSRNARAAGVGIRSGFETR